MDIESATLNKCFAADHHGRVGFVEPPRFPYNVTPANSPLEPYRPAVKSTPPRDVAHDVN